MATSGINFFERRHTSVISTTAEDVLREALQLSEGERVRVAAELLASLEPDVETRDGEAWGVRIPVIVIAELERRAQAKRRIPWVSPVLPFTRPSGRSVFRHGGTGISSS